MYVSNWAIIESVCELIVGQLILIFKLYERYEIEAFDSVRVSEMFFKNSFTNTEHILCSRLLKIFEDSV